MRRRRSIGWGVIRGGGVKEAESVKNVKIHI